ncbi:MAG: hypothetical protein A2465_01210 [Bacteroidetes bacterium RIFOXYC2_FULL_39_11]|nr:MAG: hypothetical protein A2465_01210 [Bacteroidetes bacterium RIFOXYC2_FULL_39_11]
MTVKIFRKSIYSAVLFLTAATLCGQQKIDPTLEVKRDYDAKLLEITKGKLYSSFADSLGIFDMSFRYSIFERPLKDLYEFSPLPSASIESEKRKINPIIYMKAGSNFPFNPYGNLYIQPRLPESLSMLFYAGHESYHGKLRGVDVNNLEIRQTNNKYYAPSQNNDAGFKFAYKWKSGETGINAGFHNIMNSYYGITAGRSYMKDSLSQKNNIYSAGVFLKSAETQSNSFIYALKIGYSALKGEASFTAINDPLALISKESDAQTIEVSALMGAGFGVSNKILAGITYESANSYGSESFDRSNLELHPRYIFQRGRWDFEAGLKYNIWWEPTERDYNIYFKGMASFRILKDNLWIYAGIDGKNNFTTYQKLLEINPWIHPEIDIKNTEQPVIARGGIKGKVFERMTFNVYAGYYEYNNQIYFYSVPYAMTGSAIPSYSYNAIHQHEKRTGVGADFAWKSEGLEAGAGFDFYGFRDNNNMTNNHYNYSPLEIRSNIRYNWRERIIANITADYRKKSPALFLEDLLSSYYNPERRYAPSYALINLELSYVYSKNLSLFFKVNNILDSEVIFMSRYSMPGINGGVGLSIKF